MNQMSNLRNGVLTVSGVLIGILVMGGIRNAVSAVGQCENLSRGSQIELPSGRIMTCQ